MMGPATMPTKSRENLALRLRQNWLAKHPADIPSPAIPLDDSLTSLNWLQNLNIMKIGTPTPPASPTPNQEELAAVRSIVPLPHSYPSNMQVDPNVVLNMTNAAPRIKQEPGLLTCSSRHNNNNNNPLSVYGMELTPPPPMLPNTTAALLDKVDYATNPHIKPPYSYATLICMAMRESTKNKITLSGIYNWITENFMYYRVADPSWQNSIRHNLSLNKCFQKVARRKDEPGKGGFWRINPDNQDMFVNGIFKKRRCTAAAPPTRAGDSLCPPPLKRIKRENDDSNCSSECSDTGTDEGCMPALFRAGPVTRRGLQAHALVKTEPGQQGHRVGGGGNPDDLSEALDFSWNAILNQDIEVSGVKVKTEDIIDEKDAVASPITALSPPPSESNSDVSLEDLLNAADLAADTNSPLDLQDGGEALDLTVTGISINAPSWWGESLNAGGPDSATFIQDPNNRSSMSTPVHAPSPSHPWAESHADDLDLAIASFDADFGNLFDIDNLPSPKMSAES